MLHIKSKTVIENGIGDTVGAAIHKAVAFAEANCVKDLLFCINGWYYEYNERHTAEQIIKKYIKWVNLEGRG